METETYFFILIGVHVNSW